jgi:hypothetical protein
MDDKQVDTYITKQIKKRRITLYDIIGGKHIDPTPDAIEPPPGQRARWNRFSYEPSCLRLCELLTPKGFDPDDPYRRLAVPVKDLARYWWNNCVEQETVLDDIFEDILDYHKDRMLPQAKPKERADVSGAIEGVLEVI